MRTESCKFLARFYPEAYYHVYNRTNNKEKLFKLDELDQVRFVNQLDKYLSPFVEIFCFCLMQNHFHLLIKIKKLRELNRSILLKDRGLWSKCERDFIIQYVENQDVHKLISQSFNSVFNSYTKSSNFIWSRKGNLFNHQFKRVRVKSPGHLLDVVEYINLNPVKHGLVSHPKDYPWSSYNMILSGVNSWLEGPKVLSLYGSKERFEERHEILLWRHKSVKTTPGVDFQSNVPHMTSS